MSIIKNLLLTTALISTASITNAASITNGDFSDGSFGWSTPSTVTSGTYSTTSSSITPWEENSAYIIELQFNPFPFQGDGSTVINESLSSSFPIGEINTGDILNFSLDVMVDIAFFGGPNNFDVLFADRHPGMMAARYVDRAFSDLSISLLFDGSILELSNDEAPSSLLSSENLMENIEPPLISFTNNSDISIPIGHLVNQSGGFNLVLEGVINERAIHEYANFYSEFGVGLIPEFSARYIFDDFSITNTNEVPVPAAAWLFGSALAGLSVIRRKNNPKILVAEES
jgi:hypothetical protein